jgi:two-component system, chemotaxis family, sensor kinase CheA
VFPENPKESAISSFSKAAEIISQLGEELAFVAPDQDTGLLPINRFVMDLEELAEADVPPPLAAGLHVARAWLDQTLDGPGKFTEEIIRNFNEWHAWMMSVLEAWQTGTVMPAWPEGWAPIEKAVTATETDRRAAALMPSGAEEPSIRLNLAEDLGLLREFHGESLELLQGIEQGVLVLEENPADAATIDSIFRAFHTLKGAAGFLHLDALRDLAHDLESLLDAVRCSELRITSEIIDLILAGADALKHFTREIGSQLEGTDAGAPILIPTRQIIARVQSSLRGEPPPEAADSLEGVECSQTAGASSPPNAKTSELAAESKFRQSAVGAPRDLTIPSPSSGFVKLDTAKLDNLVDLVGELVIAQSMVVQNPDVQMINSLQLVRCLRQLSRITTELQRNAMSLRMVPIRAMFHKMNRLVRDLAAQQRKQVQLVLEGEETELDRNIVEKLSDPLVHMIRNAVGHGLEYPADRIAQGKPELGTIRLTAAHQRGGIVIRIQDDGKGLDRGRILAKAIDHGLVKANANLTESEIFSLIFQPGFSTAESVTDLSGRGVGMDVVGRNIENLRGKVEIQSLPGQGATFTILLPLTLAIIDGLLVGVGGDRYIIPTLSIRESFRPPPGMVTTVHGRGEVVSVRGRQTPLLRLGHYLGTASRAVKPEDGIIVVVESGDAARGLLVDELIGKQEVVIKSLGRAFRQQNLLAGGAVLGDGGVGLILDVDTLVQMPYQPPQSAVPASPATP